MKCSILTIGFGAALIFAISGLSQAPTVETKLVEVARSLDLLVRPEKGETIISGPGKSVVKGRTKPLDPKKVAPSVAEILKVQPNLVQEALKTRKVSEIVYAKFISEKGTTSFKELIAQKDQILSVEALRSAAVPLEPVKEALDQIYTEVAFVSLDEMK